MNTITYCISILAKLPIITTSRPSVKRFRPLFIEDEVEKLMLRDVILLASYFDQESSSSAYKINSEER